MTPPTTYRIVPGEAVDYLPGKTWAYHAACKDWSKMGGPLAYFPGETHYCHSDKRPTHDPTAPAAQEWIKDAVHEITLHSFGAIHNLKEETAYRQTIEGIIACHAPATPAIAAAQGGDIPRTPTDSEMLDWLEKNAKGSKWADVLPAIRPVGYDGDYCAKYVGEDGWGIRAAIEAEMMKEKQS